MDTQNKFRFGWRILLALFLMLSGTCLALKAQNGSEDARAAMREEMHSYYEENILPVLKPLRMELEQSLTAKERETIDQVRKDLAEKHMQAKSERADNPGQHRGREERKELRDEYQDVLEPARPILDAHVSEIHGLLATLEDKPQTWKNDLRSIHERYQDQLEPKRQHQDDQMKGRKGKGKGKKHRARGPEKMLEPLEKPMMFLLWNPEKPYGPKH